MLLHIAIIAYLSLHVAAILGADNIGEKIFITVGTICGGVVATLLYLAALGIYEM